MSNNQANILLYLNHLYKIAKTGNTIVQVKNNQQLIGKNNNKIYILIVFAIDKINQRRAKLIQQQILTYRKITAQYFFRIDSCLVSNKSGQQTIYIKRMHRSFQNLKRLLISKQNLDIQSIFKNIIKALKFLHDQGISHNNISLDTVLIRKDKLKLDVPLFSTISKCQSLKQKAKMLQTIYCPPQVYRNTAAFPLSGDLWALGIVLLQLVLQENLQERKRPLKKDQLMQYIQKIKIPFWKQIILGLLEQNPKLRKTLKIQQLEVSDSKSLVKHSRFVRLLKIPLFQSSNQRSYPRLHLSQQTPVNSKFFSHILPGFEVKASLITDQMIWFIVKLKMAPRLKSSSYFFMQLSFINLPSHLQNYITMPKLFDLMKEGRQQFLCLSDGSIQFQVAESELKILVEQQQKKNRAQKVQYDDIFKSWVGNIAINNAQKGHGFVINNNLVLTLGSILSNDLSKDKTIIFGTDSIKEISKSKNYCFSKSLKLKEQNKFNNDFAIIILEKIIHLDYYPTLIQNFSPNLIDARMHEIGIIYTYFYLIGQIKINKHDLIIKGQTINWKVPTQPGLPIMVKFSNNKMACIGMTTTPTQGLLFSLRIINQIFQWLGQRNICDSIRYYELRVINVSFFKFQQPQLTSYLPTLRQYFFQGEKQIKNLDIANIKSICRDLISKYEFVKAALTLQELAFRQENLTGLPLFTRAINIYQHVYGQNFFKISALHFSIGLIRCNQANQNYHEAYMHLNKCYELENKYNYHPTILGILYQKMGLALCELRFLRQSENFYDLAVSIHEQRGNYQCLSEIYHNYSLIKYELQGNSKNVIVMLEKAVQYHQTNTNQQPALSKINTYRILMQRYIQASRSMDALKVCIKAVKLSIKKKAHQCEKRQINIIKQIHHMWRKMTTQNIAQINNQKQLKKIIDQRNQELKVWDDQAQKNPYIY